MINIIVLLSAFCTCATFDTLDKSYSPELTLSSLSKLKFSSQIKYQITRKKQKSCPRLIGPRCRSFIISVPSGENTPRFLGPPRTALAQVYGLQQVPSEAQEKFWQQSPLFRQPCPPWEQRFSRGFAAANPTSIIVKITAGVKKRMMII